MKFLIFASALLCFIAVMALLAGCAPDREKAVTTITADIAVAVPCDTLTKLGADPVYLDSAAALSAVPHADAIARLKANPADVMALTDEIANLGYQAKLLLAGRAQRMQRDREKQAALDGCAGTHQPS